MKTSCLINNFNYARFVDEAIESALGQTEPFDEVIVVDDGSTDGSLEMLQGKYDSHPIVSIVGKANEGQLSCFNEGFTRSTGDVVFFLDADDTFEPNYVEKTLETYQSDPYCDFLFCGRRLFGHQDDVLLAYPEDRDLGYSIIRTARSRDWVGGATSTLSMRRSVLEKILPLPFVTEWRLRADDCLVFGASLAGARKRFLAQPLVNYRVHQNNQYHGRTSDRAATFRRRLAISRLFEHFERTLSFSASRLSDLTHREFETIEKPTVSEFLRYVRISLGADISLLRRMACVVEITRYYLSTMWQGTDSQPSETPSSTTKPASSQNRLAA